MNQIPITAALCTLIACISANAQTAAPPSTMADILGSVSVSGIVDVYAGTRQLAGAQSLNRVDSSGMSTSQINLTGEKKLAGGLTGEFSLGMFLRPDDGGQGRFVGDTFFGRNAYVGLGGDFGTVRLGRQGTGNFLNFLRTNSFGDSSTFGPAFVHTWVSAIAQGTQFVTPGAPAASKTLTGALGTTDSAWNNSVVYLSPKLGGTTIQLQWAPSEAAGIGARVGAAAFYSAGPLALGLATEQIGLASVPASGPAAGVIAEQVTWHLSGAYTFGFGRLSAGWLATRRDFTTLVDDNINTMHVGVTMPLGSGNFIAQVANTSLRPDTGADITRTTTSLGYTYPIVKDAEAYLVLMNDQVTGLANGNSLGLGIRLKF